jgi:hypothetical protein
LKQEIHGVGSVNVRDAAAPEASDKSPAADKAKDDGKAKKA